jgi:hypothetical protein
MLTAGNGSPRLFSGARAAHASEELDRFRGDWARPVYRQATAVGIAPADADKLCRRVFNGEPKHKAADALGITARDLGPVLTEAALRDDFTWDRTGSRTGCSRPSAR